MVFTKENWSVLKMLIKASGYVYRNHTHTVSEFIGLFGFNPRKFPEYFDIQQSTDIVSAKKAFNHLCDQYFNWSDNNRKALGIAVNNR